MIQSMAVLPSERWACEKLKLYLHIPFFPLELHEPHPKRPVWVGGGRGILFRAIPNALRSCLGCFQSETADRLAKPALTFWVASAFRQGCCVPMCLRQGECVGGPLCHCQCPHHSGHVLSVCDREKRRDVCPKCWLSQSNTSSKVLRPRRRRLCDNICLRSTESSPNAK